METIEDVTESGDVVVCLSVFTHIPRVLRQAYLEWFLGVAPRLLVDILPGEEGGNIGAWYADPDDFAVDMAWAGWAIDGEFDRHAETGYHHRYYSAHDRKSRIRSG
jgi:hypothetical protein